MNSTVRLQKLAFDVAFGVMGFSFAIAQTLMVRELLVSFAGNELSIGVVLGSWLLLEALGSALLGRFWGRRHRVASYLALQLLFAGLLLPVLYLAFGLRHLVGSVPGEGLGLRTILCTSFLLLIPLALVDGAMFTVGCRVAQRLLGAGVQAVGRVYLLEATGSILGGLIFTFLFIPHLGAVRVALLLVVVNLASGLGLLWSEEEAIF